jgi:hypothetical protein
MTKTQIRNTLAAKIKNLETLIDDTQMCLTEYRKMFNEYEDKRVYNPGRPRETTDLSSLVMNILGKKGQSFNTLTSIADRAAYQYIFKLLKEYAMADHFHGSRAPIVMKVMGKEGKTFASFTKQADRREYWRIDKLIANYV